MAGIGGGRGEAAGLDEGEERRRRRSVGERSNARSGAVGETIRLG
jgi:hypothetical protein